MSGAGDGSGCGCMVLIVIAMALLGVWEVVAFLAGLLVLSWIGYLVFLGVSLGIVVAIAKAIIGE